MPVETGDSGGILTTEVDEAEQCYMNSTQSYNTLKCFSLTDF